MIRFIENVSFPRIAIKSSPGAVIVREREKVVDEKITRRTEEVSCPITGQPKLRTVEYVEKVIETEVETCQEKIISLELQDPEREVPIFQECDDDVESVSIVTIRGNPDKLFLQDYSHKNGSHKPVSEEIYDGDEHSIGGSGGRSAKTSASSTSGSHSLVRTIVEVVNPTIAGDGCPNKIAIGRSSDCSHPSFDSYSHEANIYTYDGVHYDDIGHSNQPTEGESEQEDDDAMGYESRESCSERELSLNDKMKNVLQELLENERVKLNLSRSLIENELSEPEEDEEGVEYDDVSTHIQNQIKSNENQSATNISKGFVSHSYQMEEENLNKSDLSQNASDTFAFFVDGCRVYRNPNTEMCFDGAEGNNDDDPGMYTTTTVNIEGTETATTSNIVKDYYGATTGPGATSENENSQSLEGVPVSQMQHVNNVKEMVSGSGELKPLEPQFLRHDKINFSSSTDKDDDIIEEGSNRQSFTGNKHKHDPLDGESFNVTGQDEQGYDDDDIEDDDEDVDIEQDENNTESSVKAASNDNGRATTMEEKSPHHKPIMKIATMQTADEQVVQQQCANNNNSTTANVTSKKKKRKPKHKKK